MVPLHITLIAFIFGYLYFRYWMNGRYFSKSHRADGKTVIITGASSGIGKETAIGMAERGAKVIMACRDLKKAENVRLKIISKTKNPNVRVLQLDLASFKSIRKFAETFLEQESRLDILINNAGVMGLPKTLTEDGLEMHMGVNHFDHFLLTLLLIDRLKESKPSRIITVSSWGHKFVRFNRSDLNSEKSYNRFNVYLQSKIANVTFTIELAGRLQHTGVTATCLHPGVADTEIHRNSNSFFIILTRTICSIISKLFLRSITSASRTSLFAALDFNYQNITGVYYENLRTALINPDADDRELRKWLWEHSEKITGIQFPLKTSQMDINNNNYNLYTKKNNILKQSLFKLDRPFFD